MSWQVVKRIKYPAFYTYKGEYGGTIVEFVTGPEQIPFMDKLGEWLADRVPREAEKKGVTPMYLNVIKDTDPTWTTKWQVQFWGHGSLTLVALLALLPFIIKGAIALLVVFVLWKIVQTFSGLWQATPQELEREEAREEFVEKLIERGYSPEEIADIIAGIKTPPAGIELPEIPTAAIAFGGVAVLLIALLFMRD
ncbi:hypothetical protein ES705_14606 [subsurface metagenome]